LYYLFNQIDLYNTRLSIILITAALHTAFGTYLLSSVFRTFNQDILESARLDGCNKLQLLLRIVIPLSWPTLSVLFVFFFIWTWNDFFLPLIFLISNDNQTVPIAMALARGERGMVITIQSAAAFLGVFPAFIFFLLFQRTLTKGIMSGSSK
ncbi:MAG: carbohydrate ABC transporter permease, partial [Anaerolineae bacterium]|nr:carbohydrate ABC transporter permease [Anaerolineae bacterium]